MHQGNPNGRANGLPIQGATPFAASEVRYHLVRCKPGVDAFGIAINPAILGVEVHYLDKRSHPCVRKERPCQWCELGNRLRWYGYMPALLPDAGRIGIIEITYEAIKRWGVVAANCVLRGKGIRVHRHGKSERGRCELIFEDVALKGKLPEPIDTEKALYDIWNDWIRQPSLPTLATEVPS